MKILSTTRIVMCKPLMESVQLEEATNVTPETLFYRTCGNQEFECVANGGDAGRFWLDQPYYKDKACIYLRTPWSNLGTTSNSPYGAHGEQQTMTADGRIQDHKLVEMVEVRPGQGEPHVKPWHPLVWTCPPLEMYVDRELNDGTPLEWVDSYTSDVQVNINFRRFEKIFQFQVSDAHEGVIVQRFTTLKSAQQFAYKYVKEGFSANLAHRS